MKITPLKIIGAWLIEAPVYPDNRGLFREWFSFDFDNSFGIPKFEVRQANTSVSSKGVIRGIHYSNQFGGQSKLVTCTSGSVLDAIVDLRPGSVTFGESVTVELSSNGGNSVFISSGLGHGFQALEENVAVTYLLDKKYEPKMEFGVNPLDKALGVEWRQIPTNISEKDMSSPSFNSLRILG